jgi:hypothetical protein
MEDDRVEASADIGVDRPKSPSGRFGDHLHNPQETL